MAYAFRAPARYHVPGHKGGPGADPGVRKAIGADALAADVPQDIHGIDLGPSPTPYERAEQLAAEAFGAERSFFLTNGATQGNHTLCLALAPLGARIVAQRNSHASIVDGLVLSGGMPSFVAPGVRRGARHHPLRHAGGARGARSHEAPDARAAFLVSPTYYGMAADVAGLRRGRARAPACRSSSTRRGGRTSASPTTLPPTALSQGADAMLTSTHKIAGSLTQSAMLHVGARRRGSTRRRWRARCGCCARRARRRCCSRRSTAPAASSRCTASSCCDETLRAIEVARAKLETIPGIALVDASLIGRMGVAGYDPLRIVLDVRGTGRTGYEIADALRRSYDVHVELPMQATVVFVVGLGESPAALRRLAGDVDEVVMRAAHGRRDGAARAARRLARATRWRCRRATRSSARRSWWPSTTRSGGSRASRSPATRPASRRCCRGSASRRRRSPTCASSPTSGARLHGASDPEFQTINVLVERA